MEWHHLGIAVASYFIVVAVGLIGRFVYERLTGDRRRVDPVQDDLTYGALLAVGMVVTILATTWLIGRFA